MRNAGESIYLWQLFEGFLDFRICRNVVLHLAVVEALIGIHVKVASAGETENDVFFFAGLLALHGLVNGSADGMAAFGCRKDAFHPGELLRSGKYIRLNVAARFDQTVIVELAERGTHAMIAQTARMVGGGDIAAAQGIHLRQRAHHARITEIISVFAAGEAGAGRRFHGDDAVILFTP